MLKFIDKHHCGMAKETRDQIKAVIVRIILILHGLVSTWRAVVASNNSYIWIIAASNILLVAETFHSVIKRKGQERKWFCPCFLLFLLCNIPSMWVLKMEHLLAVRHGLQTGNMTVVQTEAVTTIRGTAVASPFTIQCWPNVLEQTMIFILIIGRWYLPRGELTRSQLSQLLFTFIGTGSDALEIFVVFEEAEVRSNVILCVVTLFVWSISLLQFMFVLTAVRDENKLSESPSVWSVMLTTDIWSLLLSAFLHDLPYFFLRLYVLVFLQVYSYGILFFTCKNFILIAAMIYRIEILCVHKKDYEEIN